MRARLSTPTVHRVITSPLGALLDTRAFEELRLERLPTELRLARLGAAALALRDPGVDVLLSALGVVRDVPKKLRRRLTRGISLLAKACVSRDEIEAHWERAFWENHWPPPGREELVRLERERRACARRCVSPQAALGFFATDDWFPALVFDVPSPGDMAGRWARELVRPELAYAAPSELPRIERSRKAPGPAGDEYWLRFQSPSPLGDVVHARVFEPARGEGARATFIYMGGLLAPLDASSYWPEEETFGRSLASRGLRVILPEPPFHGRRISPGRAAGEVFLSTAPEGFFQGCAAGALEMAVLVAWAREMGSVAVGIGGASLGALAAQALAGRARSFSRGMRPDMVFLTGAARRLDELLLSAKLAAKIGLPEAILAAGWTREALHCLRDLLDPLPEPGISPDRIFALLAEEDAHLPFALGRDLLQQWRVPTQNVTLLRGGQTALALHLARHGGAQRTITASLLAASQRP